MEPNIMISEQLCRDIQDYLAVIIDEYDSQSQKGFHAMLLTKRLERETGVCRLK